jgi:hypothetical protein
MRVPVTVTSSRSTGVAAGAVDCAGAFCAIAWVAAEAIIAIVLSLSTARTALRTEISDPDCLTDIISPWTNELYAG